MKHFINYIIIGNLILHTGFSDDGKQVNKLPTGKQRVNSFKFLGIHITRNSHGPLTQMQG